MSIKKRITTGLATICLVGALVGGATFAMFTDTENTSAAFAAGKVDLAVCPEIVTPITCMAPGDTGSYIVYVNNLACLDLVWRVTPSLAGDLAAGANGLNVTVRDSAGNVMNGSTYRTMTPSTAGMPSDFITVEYELPRDADNSYTLDTATITLDFDAEQADNNTAPFTTLANHPNAEAPDYNLP